MAYLRPSFFAVLLATAVPAFAQQGSTCAAPLAFAAHAGLTLTVESRSGEIVLAGSDQEGIRVTCTLPDPKRAADVHVHFEQTGDFSQLHISGGPDNNFRVRIEVPRQTNLRLQVPAGEVRVEEISGNKDISVKAGDIQISGVSEAEYRSVHASVGIGALSASSFGVGKGGFFRSLDRDALAGRYRLRVHLMTGNINLN